MQILSFFKNLLYPVSCISCQARGTSLCTTCHQKMPPAPFLKNEHLFAALEYKDPIVKEGIRILKNRSDQDIARAFARSMYDSIFEELANKCLLENFQNPLLVPIPVSKKRLVERGFNQAEIITQAFKSLDPFLEITTGVLVKEKHTEKQALSESKKDRLKNLRGSFSVKNTDRIQNKSIILVDDVTTTGATLEEARKILLKAGAKHVIGIAVAH